MMFLAHVSFSTALVTLVLGFAMLAWSKKETNSSSLLKFGGSTVVILSMLNLLCIGYYTTRYSLDGYFNTPNGITRDSNMGMMGDMKCMENMKGMMGEQIKKNQGEGVKPETSPMLPEDHEAHH